MTRQLPANLPWEPPTPDDPLDWHDHHAARSDERQARQEERDRYREEMS